MRRFRMLGMSSLVAMLMLSAVPARAGTLPFQFTFGDAVTGYNQFISNDGKHRWFVNPGADNYFMDFYERPTAQTYTQQNAAFTVPNYSSNVTLGQSYVAASQYFEYLDIVNGHFSLNNQTLHMGIELFGVNKVGDNGVRTSDFGESTYYNIRISNDPNGRGGLLLTSINAKDLTSNWQTQEAFGYLDTDRGVGGPGGIAAVNETTNLNGYETPIIADGKLVANNQNALELRRTTSGDNRPIVEFALNLALFNSIHAGYAIDPTKQLYIVFEATRGLKGNSNYLWNDKYSFVQAGNPYSTVGLGNIYELDTLYATFVVPVPGAGALLLFGVMRKRRRRG
jgi:hypothetical protein